MVQQLRKFHTASQVFAQINLIDDILNGHPANAGQLHNLFFEKHFIVMIKSTTSGLQVTVRQKDYSFLSTAL